MLDLDGFVTVGRGRNRISIPLADLTWRFTRSGGPGGQHVNTTSTRVELVLDLNETRGIDPATRSLLIERLGTTLRIVADDERSQLRNRALALRRLSNRLAAALVVEVPRVPTKPSRAAKNRRLVAKAHNSQRKVSRRRVDRADEA